MTPEHKALVDELDEVGRNDSPWRLYSLCKRSKSALAEKDARIAELEAAIVVQRESKEYAQRCCITAETTLTASRAECEGLRAALEIQTEATDFADENRTFQIGRAEKAERKLAALKGDWHGVLLDGRNEHGSHVLMLPQRSIELDQDSNGDFLKSYAETILVAADAMGFKVGDAVVATFDLCTDEGFFSHYEFAEVSADLTATLYGTPDEQSAARAALSQKETGE